MAINSLDDLRNSSQEPEIRSHAVIDTTQGKVERPAYGRTPDPTDLTTPMIEQVTARPTIQTTPTRVDLSANETPKEFDINSLPKRPQEQSDLDKETMNKLEEAVEREKQSITERIDAITEMQHQEFLAKMDEQFEAPDVYVYKDPAEPEPTEEDFSFDEKDFSDEDFGSDNSAAKVESSVPDLSNIDEDILAETGELHEKVDEEKMLEEIKQAVRTSIVPIKNKINLNEFTVSDTPIAASKAVSFNLADLNRADWVLPNSNSTISVSGLTGPEIFTLQGTNDNRSRLNRFKDVYSIIYKHILGKKPNFETWLKTTKFSDVDHIYFALYKATFADSNFLYYECPECHKVFIKDKTFDEMVVYKDADTEARMKSILAHSEGAPTSEDVTRYQVSDQYVIDIKEPSIYTTMEFSSLSDKFLDKYADLIDVLTYTDKIYKIDLENRTLIPIDTNKDNDSMVKTVGRRISIFASIFNTLPSDNFIDLRAFINKKFLTAEKNEITYRVPADECPNCKHKFDAEPMGASTLLFTRQQLGALGAI